MPSCMISGISVDIERSSSRASNQGTNLILTPMLAPCWLRIRIYSRISSRIWPWPKTCAASERSETSSPGVCWIRVQFRRQKSVIVLSLTVSAGGSFGISQILRSCDQEGMARDTANIIHRAVVLMSLICIVDSPPSVLSIVFIHLYRAWVGPGCAVEDRPSSPFDHRPPLHPKVLMRSQCLGHLSGHPH